MTTARVLLAINKIDLGNMDAKTNRALAEFLQTFPGDIITTTTKISLPELNPAVEFTLSHEIRGRWNQWMDYYEIVGPITPHSWYDQFELVGRLLPQDDGALLYEPVTNTYVIDALKNITIKTNPFEDTVRTITQSIDAANFNNEQKQIIGLFLNEAIKQNQFVFPEGTNCLEMHNPETNMRYIAHLNFATPVIFRSCEDDPYQYRFEVQGEAIGKGKFAEVYHSNATLVPQPDGGLEAKLTSTGKIKRQHRVIKKERIRQPINKRIEDLELNNESDIKKMYLLGKLTPHLQVKSPTFMKEHSYSIGKYFAGFGLDSLIENIWNKTYLPNVDTRLRHMRQILYAAKEQVHDRMLVHRDLKKENIRLSATDANIIDYGLSKHSTYDDSGDGAGTPIYNSPEVFQKMNTSPKADIYTLGIMLAYLWGADDLLLTIKTEAQACELANNIKFSNLFQDISQDLSDKQRIKLEKCIYAMCHSQAKSRAKLEEIIEIVEKIILRRKFSTEMSYKEKKRYKKMRTAQNKARELKKEMQYQPTEAYRVLETKLETALQGLSGSPLVLEEFISVLHLDCLKGIKSKPELLSKVQSLTKTFDNLVAELETKKLDLNRVDCAIAHRVSRYVNNALKKLHTGCITLDDTVRLSKKFQKTLQKIAAEMTVAKTNEKAIRSATMQRLFHQPQHQSGPLKDAKPEIHLTI